MVPLTDPTGLLNPLAARCTFPDGDLVCAVSGGPDSLALLALAVHVRGADRVCAVHVDHQLRPGSAAEADVVRAVADDLGASFQAVTVEVGIGPNLEARARDARYAALPDRVCTGHTLDDVAETIVANLIRGAGLDGLNPMFSALSKSGRSRPLLQLRRSETHALCASFGWSPVVDPMNTDPALLRTRIRHEVLPLLDEISQRDVAPLLVRNQQVAADDLAVLNALASEIDPTDALALSVAPLALARRALRQWLIDSGINEGHPSSLATLDRIMSVARGEVVATEIVGGWRVARTNQRLRLVPPLVQPLEMP